MQILDDAADGAEGFEFGEAGWDDVGGAAALFGVRGLAGDDGFDLRHRQAAFADAGDLDVARAGDGDGAVDAAVAAGLEEQGNVQQHGAAVGAEGPAAELLLLLADQRVHDGFQPAHGGVVAQDLGAEFGAVEHAVVHRAGEGFGEGGNGAAVAGLQAVDGFVGVEAGDAVGGEHFGGGGFAHADAAGEAEDDHAPLMRRRRCGRVRHRRWGRRRTRR